MPATNANKGLDRRPDVLGWTAFGVFALWFAWDFIPNVAMPLRFEDQMIVLRYARNLTEGNGLVYNPGERVMGFTTPLYTLLSSVFVLLGGEQAPVWQNVFGALCLLATAAVAARLLVRLGAGAAAPLAVALLTFNPWSSAFNYLYVTMETHLFALLFVLAVDLHVSGRRTAAAVTSALLFLTRPEGVLLTACLLGDQWVRDRRPPVLQAAAALLAAAPWLLFAKLYYGTVFPLTLAAKSGGGSLLDWLRQPLEHVRRAAVYVEQVGGIYHEAASGLLSTYVSPSNAGLFAVAWLLLGVSAFLGAIAIVRSDSRAWPLVGFPASLLGGLAAIGAWPMFTWHYYPLSTLGAIALAFGAHTVFEWCAPESTERRRPAARSAAARWVLWVGLALLAVPPLNNTRGQIDPSEVVDGRRRALEYLARELAARYDEETTVLVDEIGFVGWHSRLRIVDRGGLVTPGLRYEVTREEAVRRHAPDLMLVRVDASGRPDGRSEEGFPFGYEVVAQTDASPDWSYRLYARPGLEFD